MSNFLNVGVGDRVFFFSDGPAKVTKVTKTQFSSILDDPSREKIRCFKDSGSEVGGNRTAHWWEPAIEREFYLRKIVEDAHRSVYGGPRPYMSTKEEVEYCAKKYDNDILVLKNAIIALSELMEHV